MQDMKGKWRIPELETRQQLSHPSIDLRQANLIL